MKQQNTGALLSALKPELRLPAARLKACDALPYFSAGVNDLVPYVMPGLGQIGVTSGGVLMYDPDVLGQWTALEAGAVLLHEYMHVFGRHERRFQELVRRGVAQDNKEDRDLWNQAADAEINDNLEDAGLPLPSINGCPPCTPTSLGLDRHLTGEQYFSQLLERRQQQQSGKGKGKGKGGGPGKSPGCGSGAGNPWEDEPDAQTLAKLERDPVSQDVTRQTVAEKIVERANQRGDVPAGLLAQAKSEIPSSDIPWEDQLLTAVSAGVAHVEGMGDYTFTVPSRWQSALIDEFGEDDAPVLPGEHQPLPKVATAFDLSGSVPDEDISRMCGHTMGMLDSLGGMSVTFLACDAAVHAVAEVRTIDDLLKNLKGRGGTDFRPVFEEIAKWPEKPEILVFQTDGFGPAPATPPGYKVIWLITPNGRVPWAAADEGGSWDGEEVDYGTVIWMSKEDRQLHARESKAR
jgi:predicted metal-dependent peptidase